MVERYTDVHPFGPMTSFGASVVFLERFQTLPDAETIEV